MPPCVYVRDIYQLQLHCICQTALLHSLHSIVPVSGCSAAALLWCGAKLVQNVRIRLIPLMLGTRLWPGHMQG